MPQAVLTFGIEVPKNVYEKWGKFLELANKINADLGSYPKVRRKLEGILRGQNITITSEDCEDQQPEPFTRQHVIDPLLKFLGYELTPEVVKRTVSVLGSSMIKKIKQPDYRVKSIFGEEILIEAEPLGSNLYKKGSGVNQVIEWLDRRSFNVDIGIATNGFEWILLYYDNTSKEIKTLAEIDLAPIFNYLSKREKGLIIGYSVKELRELFVRFYYAFSREYIEEYIEGRTKFIREKKEAITKKFYDDFIYYVFGYREVKTNSKTKLKKVTNNCLYDKIKAPLDATEEDKQKFAVVLMNRLIFVKFLEDKGLVPGGLLKRTFEEWRNSSVPVSYYKAYLEPLFFGVFNTPEEERDRKVIEHFRDIPYLNGGLFRENLRNEKQYDIPDDNVMEEIIKFLERYDFTLGSKSNEESLDPDILGHVYEKLINLLTNKGQKGLGAYYTPEEVTRTIVKSTVEPVVIKKLKEVLKKWGWQEQLLNFSTLDEVLNEDRPITRDGRVLKDFLDEINKMKILDPAVGSGHFLISVLKELLEIKKRVHSLIGEEFNTYKLKLEIILNNLYGVDIDETAVEVAKLRLWLALIEDLDVDAVRRGDVILPNIEYNVRVGNSLVGWIGERLTIATLDYPYDKKVEGIFIGLKALATGEEAVKIKKAEELLKDHSSTVKDYVEAYCILYEIYKNNVGKKAAILKEILESIRRRIYQRVSGEYFNFINDTINENRRKKKKIKFDEDILKPFHWVVDFGWIMKEGGFDIIIGNPPYGNILSNIEKDIIDTRYREEEATYSVDSFLAFMRRSQELLKDGGYLGFIIPASFGTGVNYTKARKHFLQTMELKVFLYLPFDVFEGAYVDNSIIVLKNEEPSMDNEVLIYAFPKRSRLEELLTVWENPKIEKIRYSLLLNDPLCRIFPGGNVIYEILDHISSLSQRGNYDVYPLGDLTNSTIGILASKYKFSLVKLSKWHLPYLEGNVYRYITNLKQTKFVDFSQHKDNKDYLDLYLSKEKIMIRRIVSRQDRIMASFCNLQGVVKKDLYVFNLKSEFLSLVDYYYLLALINSKLLSFIYLGKSSIALKDDFRQTTLTELRELPIVIPHEDVIKDVVSALSKLLTELYSNVKYKKYCEFVDLLLDYLIYCIYFPEILPQSETEKIFEYLYTVVNKFNFWHDQIARELFTDDEVKEFIAKIRKKAGEHKFISIVEEKYMGDIE
ncbi:Eco57I restriction-modification methylase domain-containing protein [Thermococcus barophilus]|uniref:site-specific DNA-methyltransferase (adenine-specific) n=1 Tax=Thermococcus barophilus (strain DSM 11836 / MP) TaxID=391623 RepID=F0LN48_THEBM|nr:N-6 DNA methylase [Thermococcus barophilus]ADT85187.1 hypothetical protein TERMP_02214 [Thermococcus barophilus MP]